MLAENDFEEGDYNTSWPRAEEHISPLRQIALQRHADMIARIGNGLRKLAGRRPFTKTIHKFASQVLKHD